MIIEWIHIDEKCAKIDLSPGMKTLNKNCNQYNQIGIPTMHSLLIVQM
jgi:hypothetical protein